MKKTTIFLLISIFIFGNFAFAADDKTTDTVSEEMNFVKCMGGFNNLDISPDAVITRGEFASVITNLCHLSSDEEAYSDWSKLNYGDDNKDTLLTQNDQGLIYTDVDQSHPYYNAIASVTRFGYMKGIASNLFAPEYPMTQQEILKVLIDVLGYKKKALAQGGYPGGYQSVALTLKLTDEIAFTSNVTQKQLAKIIDHMQNIPVMYVSEMSGDDQTLETSSDKTFMTEVLKVNKLTGVITDNGYTTIYGKSKLSSSWIKIGDTVLKINDDFSFVRDYIGREVKVFYSNVEDDDNIIKYAVLTNKDSAVSFDIVDFSAYSQNAVSYYENGERKTKQLAPVTYMLLNGVSVQKYNADTFNFESGSVTLVSDKDNQCNLIIINRFEYFYVDKVNTDDMKIYNKIKSNTSTENWIDLSASGPYKFITIENAEGAAAKFANITAGSVLSVMRQDNKVKIIIAPNRVKNIKLKEVTEENGKTYLKDDEGVQYRMSVKYKNDTKEKMNIGEEYALYLSHDGLIVWMENVSNAFKAGYLVRAAFDNGQIDKQLKLKIYTVDGEMKVLNVESKVTLIASDGQQYSKTSDEVGTNDLAAFNALLRYKLNPKGDVSIIELPLTQNVDKKQLYKVFETDSEDKNYTYKDEAGFSGHMVTDAHTKFIKIPSDLTKESGFSVADVSAYYSDNARPSIVYACEPDSLIADYVVIKPLSSDNKVGTSRTMFAVEKVLTGVYGDENIHMLKGVVINNSSVSEITLKSYYDDVSVENNGVTESYSFFEHAPSSLTGSEKKYYQIKSGDIVRCRYDDNGFVSALDLLYRPTVQNTRFPNGIKGGILESIGYYAYEVANSNPCIFGNDGAKVDWDNNKFWAHADSRFIYGYVKKTQGNLVKYSTFDLTQEADVDGHDEFYNDYYLKEIIKLNESKMITVTYNGTEVKVQRGKLSDIKSFEDVGADCSRVIVNNYWGGDTYAVIINGTPS